MSGLQLFTSASDGGDVTRFDVLRRCDECGSSDGVRLVSIVEQATGPGGGRRACTGCVPLGQGVLDEADAS